jgi:hypothetical protein
MTLKQKILKKEKKHFWKEKDTRINDSHHKQTKNTYLTKKKQSDKKWLTKNCNLVMTNKAF